MSEQQTMTKPQTKAAQDVSSDNGAKVDQEVAQARRAQKVMFETIRKQDEERKKAPAGFSARTRFVDPRKVLTERLVPEACGKNPTMAVYFDFPGDNEVRHRKHTMEGWEPVLEDGLYVHQGSDRMYKRPIALTKAHIRQAEEASADMLRAMDSGMDEARAAGLVPDEETKVTGG